MHYIVIRKSVYITLLLQQLLLKYSDRVSIIIIALTIYIIKLLQIYLNYKNNAHSVMYVLLYHNYNSTF